MFSGLSLIWLAICVDGFISTEHSARVNPPCILKTIYNIYVWIWLGVCSPIPLGFSARR